MKRNLIAVTAMSFALVGCDKGSPSAESIGSAAHHAAHDGHHHTGSDVSAPSAEVDDEGGSLPPGGKRFDPPLAISRVPRGAWYCDMGTAHFVRPEKGDGACPVCAMKLKQK